MCGCVLSEYFSAVLLLWMFTEEGESCSGAAKVHSWQRNLHCPSRVARSRSESALGAAEIVMNHSLRAFMCRVDRTDGCSGTGTVSQAGHRKQGRSLFALSRCLP
jgi:hypothetical protein